MEVVGCGVACADVACTDVDGGRFVDTEVGWLLGGVGTLVVVDACVVGVHPVAVGVAEVLLAIGLLRQYFPKGTDLSRWTAEDLAAVAHALNTRPRKTLGWRTPAEALDDHLQSLQTSSVATTD
ncbi:hypothetical protein NCCP2495_31610 [Dietzia sp. NCCP-2495]|nr:hypothetical protein NCCP2495_31610 [Dietzia sp. NCCP-2495]